MESRHICFKFLLSSRPPSLLLLVFVLCQLSEMVQCGQPCPEECSCFGDFITCDGFTEDTLRALPENVQTLILTRGTVRSFPQRFLQRLPSLSFLEIQLTDVETIVSGTFSGVKGLDQLAFVESRVGTIETGAFHDVQNVSQILISNSEIRTVQPRAFSALHDVGELNIWSSRIEQVRDRAFEDLSDIESFAFYQNNVTALGSKAFHKVRNLGKVEIRQNSFEDFRAVAVLPLTAASRESNVSSNAMSCECSSVRAFHRPELLQFLQSQTCTMPGTGAVFTLSEVNVTELCLNQPETTTPPPTSSPETRSTTPSRVINQRSSSTTLTGTQTHSSSDAPTTSLKPTTSSYPKPQQSSSTQEVSGGNALETTSPVSTAFSSSADPNLMPSTVSRFPDVRTDHISGTTASDSHPEDRTRNGGLSVDSSSPKNGVISGKQTSLVPLLVPFIAALFVSLQSTSTAVQHTQ